MKNPSPELPELLQENQVGPSLDLLPFEILTQVLNLLPPRLEYYLTSKRFYHLAYILYRKIYIARVCARTGLGVVENLKDLDSNWGRVCCVALACLYQSEWDLGAPRLFYIKSDDDMKGEDLKSIQRLQAQFPNPESPAWSSILECSMDIQTFFEENVTEQQLMSFGMLPRYSERMDIGTYLVYLNLPSGPIIFRCKPIGVQTESNNHASGKIILWDSAKFGTCSYCQRRLVRLQVCADCRISQYCSRNCQQQDWDGHRLFCKEWAFIPLIPAVEEVQENDERELQMGS
jgi:hypothetical protein